MLHHCVDAMECVYNEEALMSFDDEEDFVSALYGSGQAKVNQIMELADGAVRRA